MLEKITVIDKIEVLEDGQIQVRQATRIMEDGQEIGKTYHRWVLAPDADVTKQDDRVKAIANTVWTKEVKDAYKAKLAEKE
jgi:hypothetical protein